MGFIHEIQIVSRGFLGAPGYTNLYFRTEAGSANADQFTAARAFLALMAGLEPNSWSGQIQPVGRVLEETTGVLGAFTSAPAEVRAPVLGVSAGGYGPGPAGMVIGWGTVGINRGRLVRGRTFLVPLAAAAFGPDGTISNDTLLDTQLGAAALLNPAVRFGIWSRPRLGAGGLHVQATSVLINDQAAVLTSRRQ